MKGANVYEGSLDEKYTVSDVEKLEGVITFPVQSHTIETVKGLVVRVLILVPPLVITTLT